MSSLEVICKKAALRDAEKHGKYHRSAVHELENFSSRYLSETNQRVHGCLWDSKWEIATLVRVLSVVKLVQTRKTRLPENAFSFRQIGQMIDGDIEPNLHPRETFSQREFPVKVTVTLSSVDRPSV
ncbi:hypothetical protein TgHK011_004920 [Trichoderma gracile]|nr:hypothetical protein TgHK011_004920 [Trichoderma gracile]